MASVFFGIIVTVCAIFALVTFRRMKATQTEKEKLLALNSSVRQMQDRYKSVVSNLASDNLIDTEARRKLVAVINNYFVFQPVNPVNLAHMMDLVDVFVNTIEGHQAEPKVSEERFSEILTILATAVPDQTRDFSSHYYLNYAPGLFFEFSRQVMDDIHEPEKAEASTQADQPAEESSIQEPKSDTEFESESAPTYSKSPQGQSVQADDPAKKSAN